MKRRPPPMNSVSQLVEYAERGAEFRDWYKWAQAEIREAAAWLRVQHSVRISDRRLAELIAVFSPRVSVRRNVRWAVHYALYGSFMADVPRSTRAAVEYYERTGGIRGPKTRPFAAALMGDSAAIVLDIHMANALGIDQRRLQAEYVHKPARELIAQTAEQLGWTNAETQAAIWAGYVKGARKADGRRLYRKVPTFQVVRWARVEAGLEDLP